MQVQRLKIYLFQLYNHTYERAVNPCGANIVVSARAFISQLDVSRWEGLTHVRFLDKHLSSVPSIGLSNTKYPRVCTGKSATCVLRTLRFSQTSMTTNKNGTEPRARTGHLSMTRCQTTTRFRDRTLRQPMPKRRRGNREDLEDAA